MKSILFLLSFTLTLQNIVLSQNINISNAPIFDGEPYMAIDPNNQQHLVVAWMGFETGQKITINTAYSTDGGMTWSTPIWQAHQVPGNSSADVSLGYDNNGNLFMAYVDYDNVNFANGGIFIRKSTDGGVSWGPAVEAISSLDCPGKLCVDRPWMVIDNSGGINDGTIFITSVNADQPTMITAPYNPYLSVSTDGGNTFSAPRFLDTLNYLSGSSITQPMASPVVTSDGEFIAIYPSYEPVNQGPFAHLYLAGSVSAGTDLYHTDAYSGVGNAISDPFVKKGSLLKSDPSNPDHLAYFFLKEVSGETDIYFMESFDRGISWGSQIRINQDPVGNGKLQDLVWAEFDLDGDLAICWRDRRLASGTGYAQNTEIYGVVRWHGSTSFETDFAITDQPVPHQTILESSGNDFMNVKLLNDTLYAVWGDVRTGTLCIYLNKTALQSGTSSTLLVHAAGQDVVVYPNPANDEIKLITDQHINQFEIVNAAGQVVSSGEYNDCIVISELPSGNYLLKTSSDERVNISPLVKN